MSGKSEPRAQNAAAKKSSFGKYFVCFMTFVVMWWTTKNVAALPIKCPLYDGIGFS